MNKIRRKSLREIADQLEELKEAIENVKDEEAECLGMWRQAEAAVATFAGAIVNLLPL